MKAGATSWIEARVGTTLGTQDKLQAGNNSQAVITFFDGSTVELKAGTTIEVSSLDVANNGSTTIRLKQQIGETISNVKKLVDSASSYEIETPQGVAAVRGSILRLIVDSTDVTTVINLEGTISAIAQGVEVLVPVNMKSQIKGGQPPSQPTPVFTPGSSGGGGGGGNVASMAISTTSLPNGEVGVNYSQTLAASGGSGGYTWSIDSGNLPTGLSLNSSNGTISGTPSVSGVPMNITFKVTDSIGSTATKILSITVFPALSIVTVSLPSGILGAAYSQPLGASGGIGNYIWSIPTGALPGGLSLNAVTGNITGTPNTTGIFNFTVQADDGLGKAAKDLSITVMTVLSVSSNSTLPNGEVGVNYSQILAVSGGSGAYTWSISSGTLPTGLSLNVANGVISGMPAGSTGTAAITFKVTDSLGGKATKVFSITVYPALAIITASLPPGILGAAYSQTLRASGGSGIITWSIKAGALPNGLSLDTTVWAIMGIPITVGTSNFTIQVNDGLGTAIQDLSIEIGPGH